MRKKRLAHGDEASVDLTPMLDIVFIMQIFFIVTAVFINERGLDVTQPNDTPPPPDQSNPPKTVRVLVTASQRIVINKRDVDVRAIGAIIERARAEDPRSNVIIQPEKKAPAGIVIQIMDEAKAAGAPVSIKTSAK